MRTDDILWGHLWLGNDTEVEMDGDHAGDIINLVDSDIVDYGTRNIGDEAHVLVDHNDGSQSVLDSIEQVKCYFEQQI